MLARKRFLADAEVVCATCIGVGSDQLKPFSFPCVLVDEAASPQSSSIRR